MHSHVLSHVFTEAGTIFYSFATAYLQSLSTVYWHVGQKNCCLNEKCQLLLQAVTTKKKKKSWFWAAVSWSTNICSVEINFNVD